MYHVVMGIGPDDGQAGAKADAVVGLPRAAEAVEVTVVHASDDSELDPRRVPSVVIALDRLEEAGVETDARVVQGDPTDAVVGTAEGLDADCVCVAGRRRSPAGKVQLKGGAQQVILGTDLPVLVAGHAD